MEREGEFPAHCRHAKQLGSSPSVPDLTMKLGNSSYDSNVSAGVQAPEQGKALQHVAREQDMCMPTSNVIRIMRRVLPYQAKISDEAKETIQECVSEYISFITSEANERCKTEQRKTVTAEDVLWAMDKLGLDNYVGPLSLYLKRFRENENERNFPHDASPKRDALSYGTSATRMPPYVSIFPSVGHQGIFNAAVQGKYYRDASGAGAGAGSSSQSGLPNFGPFANFN